MFLGLEAPRRLSSVPSSETRLTAVKEMHVAAYHSQSAYFHHEIWAIYSFHIIKSLKSPYPHCGHAIRRSQERAVQDGGKVWVLLSFHDAMNAGDDTHVPLPASRRGCCNQLHGQCELMA